MTGLVQDFEPQIFALKSAVRDADRERNEAQEELKACLEEQGEDAYMVIRVRELEVGLAHT